MKKFLKLFTLTLGMAFMLFTSCSNGSDSTDDTTYGITTDEKISFNGSLNLLLSASELGKFNDISEITVEVKNPVLENSDKWPWITFTAGTSWETKIESTNENIKYSSSGWTYTINDSSLSKFVEGGFYVAGEDGGSAEIIISVK